MDAILALALPVAVAALAMTGIVVARYLAVSGGFALATRLRHPGLYAARRRQIGREIGWSLLSAAIYGVPAGVVAWGWQAHGWTRIYTDAAARPLWWLPLSVLAYLLAHDAWFYWTHRWMHRPALFARVHAVHHASRPPTAWAAMSFSPAEALSGAFVIPALVFLVPIHVAALGVVLSIMTLMGVTNHMGWELFPRPLVHGAAGRWLITASHHERHHRDYRCNYGLYFRHWDRLCGTDAGLGRFAHEGRGGRFAHETRGDDRGGSGGAGAAAGRGFAGPGGPGNRGAAVAEGEHHRLPDERPGALPRLRR